MKKRSFVFWSLGMILSISALHAQEKIRVQKDPVRQKITITAGKQPFTEFIFTDTMEKPFLYPIMAPNGQTITRGFPWNPQPNDPTDHPHHIGLWFNYENVNGLDFWNNSYNIPAEKKQQYGWIRTQKILETTSGTRGKLVYLANWTDQQKNVLLTEKTTYTFSVINGNRVIDRTTELTAVQDVSFPDVKDGMLGLRVAHELELPVLETKEYKDDKGIVTKVKATKDASVTGNYLTSEGKQGDAAWGTRGNWCMLYGKKGGDTISIVMIDHPGNAGYPTYWHARNYGLFSANPLGQKVFSQGKQVLDFALAKGQRTSFRYRVVIASGKERLAITELNKLVNGFAEQK
ncbi:MAG: PmoA family protein [Bacteroidetes bacterium]|nr:PmoA family protein [Bacteroidota bacterium]